MKKIVLTSVIFLSALSITAQTISVSEQSATYSVGAQNALTTYTIAGTYTVCLTAMNEQHCDDDTCQIVTVIPRIYTGIPNVFSPNNDQLNDILYVEGRAGISVMDLRIYNRWGELVFETTDPQAGWDGTYKGVQQEIDSYAYIFSATLVSGRTIKGQGNVTIMR
jgi:gliding motility-associated-like protein